jgi:hypothetical protein
MDTNNSQSYRSLKAKPITKESLTMTDALWIYASEELRPAAVANRAANASNNPDTDQLAANYDEKLKADGESPRKKIFEMGHE